MFTEFFRSWKGPKAHQPRFVACPDDSPVSRKGVRKRCYAVVDDSDEEESNVDAMSTDELALKNGDASTTAKKHFNPTSLPQTISLENGASMSTGPYDTRPDVCAAICKFMGSQHAMHQFFSGGNVSHYCCRRVQRAQALACLKDNTPFAEHLACPFRLTIRKSKNGIAPRNDILACKLAIHWCTFLSKNICPTGHLAGWYAVPNQSHFEHAEMCGARARLNRACLMIEGVKDAMNGAKNSVKAATVLREKFGINSSRRMVQRLRQAAQVIAY